MNYPSVIEFLEFFGTEPKIDSGVYSFRISDDRGVEAVVSFNVYDDSLQTSVVIGGREIAVVCHENMVDLHVNEGVLFAEFRSKEYKIYMKMRVTPNIAIEWAGLNTA